MGVRSLTLGQLARESQDLLAAAGIENAAPDSRILVEHFTGTTRTDALVRPEMEISEAAAGMLRSALARRAAGEPAHRIIGRREFYGLEFALSPATLEPRPDTEIVVDRVARRLEAISPRGGPRILDLGTGTGAIALALLSILPDAMAVGADIDRDAVETASGNAAKFGLAARFTGVVSDWFSGISGKFHAIVSNPPYIDAQEMALLPREVRLFDPAKALYGGPDGLSAYRAIAAGAAKYLEEDGLIGVEIGYRQRKAVTALFQENGFVLLEASQDLAGHDRVLIFTPR